MGIISLFSITILYVFKLKFDYKLYVCLNVLCADILQEWAVGVLEKKGGHLKLF